MYVFAIVIMSNSNTTVCVLMYVFVLVGTQAGTEVARPSQRDCRVEEDKRTGCQTYQQR